MTLSVCNQGSWRKTLHLLMGHGESSVIAIYDRAYSSIDSLDFVELNKGSVVERFE